MSNHLTQQKQRAANHAATYVTSGMVIGLGTGATATLFVRRLAERLIQGELTNIVGIPTSNEIAAEAKRLNFPLTTLEEHPQIDLTVDGADEVDPQFNLIKGVAVLSYAKRLSHRQVSGKSLLSMKASSQLSWGRNGMCRLKLSPLAGARNSPI
ncbi:MAG: ribose-5-phosphate isomerase A [Caldilineaceae bacterium]